MLLKFNRRSFLYSTIFFAFLSCAYADSAKFPPQVVFRGETENEAFCYIVELIQGLPWYEKHGYNIVLPEHEAFKWFYAKPANVSSVDEDYLKRLYSIELHEDYLKKIFAAEIYNRSLFEIPLKIVCKAENTVSKALKKLAELEKNWRFKLKPKYEVVITFYGTGGSYWPTGKVLLLAERIFKGDNSIEEIIIHEIVHIGIEKNIIQKYKLEHWQKERVVDLICSVYLKDILPEYKNQKKGDKRIDEFVDYNTIVNNLPTAIENFKNFIETSNTSYFGDC
ncbi:hypothetical protein KAH94_02565 [bacterium]|nr:hypothetical protein [bacterium]